MDVILDPNAPLGELTRKIAQGVDGPVCRGARGGAKYLHNQGWKPRIILGLENSILDPLST